MTRLRLDIDASPENLEPVREFLRSELTKQGLESLRIDDVVLAADEAVSNVYEHAYQRKKGRIAVALLNLKAGWAVCVSDRGKSVTSSLIPAADVSENLAGRRKGGFGVEIMRRLSDRLDFRRISGINHTILLFNKRR